MRRFHQTERIELAVAHGTAAIKHDGKLGRLFGPMFLFKQRTYVMPVLLDHEMVQVEFQMRKGRISWRLAEGRETFRTDSAVAGREARLRGEPIDEHLRRGFAGTRACTWLPDAIDQNARLYGVEIRPQVPAEAIEEGDE